MSGITPLVTKAIVYATEKHHGVMRLNGAGEKYIMHPIEVMWFLQRNGVEDPAVLAAAVLHDTIEDTDATYDDISGEFGKVVADIVQEVSDDKSLPKLERKQLQVSEIGNKSFGARVIKIGDKWSNTRDLMEGDAPKGWTSVRIYGYIAWSIRVCENALSPGDVPSTLRKAIMDHFAVLYEDETSSHILDAYYDSLRV